MDNSPVLGMSPQHSDRLDSPPPAQIRRGPHPRLKGERQLDNEYIDSIKFNAYQSPTKYTARLEKKKRLRNFVYRKQETVMDLTKRPLPVEHPPVEPPGRTRVIAIDSSPIVIDLDESFDQVKPKVPIKQVPMFLRNLVVESLQAEEDLQMSEQPDLLKRSPKAEIQPQKELTLKPMSPEAQEATPAEDEKSLASSKPVSPPKKEIAKAKSPEKNYETELIQPLSSIKPRDAPMTASKPEEHSSVKFLTPKVYNSGLKSETEKLIEEHKKLLENVSETPKVIGLDKGKDFRDPKNRICRKTADPAFDLRPSTIISKLPESADVNEQSPSKRDTNALASNSYTPLPSKEGDSVPFQKASSSQTQTLVQPKLLVQPQSLPTTQPEEPVSSNIQTSAIKNPYSPTPKSNPNNTDFAPVPKVPEILTLGGQMEIENSAHADLSGQYPASSPPQSAKNGSKKRTKRSVNLKPGLEEDIREAERNEEEKITPVRHSLSDHFSALAICFGRSVNEIKRLYHEFGSDLVKLRKALVDLPDDRVSLAYN